MSLMSLNRFIKRYGWIVMAVIAFIFIVGAVASGLGNNIAPPSATAANPAQDDTVIAVVGGEKVSRSRLERQTEQALQQQTMMGGPARPDPAEMDRVRVAALNNIKQQEALVAAAKKAGITVTDADIAALRDREWKQQRASFVQTLGLKEDASESDFNRAIIKQNPNLNEARLKELALPADQLRIAAYAEKLTDSFKKDAKADDAAVKRSLSDVSVRHILIKFGAGALPEAQAKAKADKILAEVKANPAKMADLAKQYSEDPGSKAKGGLYDWTPAQLQGIVPEFSAALNTLQPGQTYAEVVKHDSGGYSGFHIIRLESVKQGKDFPKDFDKNKQQYIDQYVNQSSQQRLMQAVNAALPGITVEISDPALHAAQLQQEASELTDEKARNAKLDEALAEYAKIDKKNDTLGIVPLQKARIYEQQKKTTEAIAAYNEALTFRNSPESRMALASLYLQQKDKESARKQLDEAEKLPPSSPLTIFQLGSLYNQIGDKKKGDAAIKRANELFMRQQQAKQEAMMQSMPTASPAPVASPAAEPAAKK